MLSFPSFNTFSSIVFTVLLHKKLTLMLHASLFAASYIRCFYSFVSSLVMLVKRKFDSILWILVVVGLGVSKAA